MINEILYWLGQAGLACSAVFGIGIVVIRGNSSGRAYFFSVWASAGLSAIVLCLPGLVETADPFWQVSLLRLSVGSAFTTGYLVVRQNLSYGVTPTQLHKANKLILYGFGVALISMVSVAFFRHSMQVAETERRKDEIIQNAQKIVQKSQQLVAAAIKADTANAAGLSMRLDSTNKLLRTMEIRRSAAAKIAAKDREFLGRRAKTIEKNTDTLKTKMEKIVPEPLPVTPKKGLLRRIFGGKDATTSGPVMPADTLDYARLD